MSTPINKSTSKTSSPNQPQKQKKRSQAPLPYLRPRLSNNEIKNEFKKMERAETQKILLEKMKRNMELLYIPKKELKNPQNPLLHFLSFDIIEGNESFNEKMSEELPVNSVQGLIGRLKHNQTTKSKCYKYYRTLHKEKINSVMSIKKSHDRLKNLSKSFSKPKAPRRRPMKKMNSENPFSNEGSKKNILNDLETRLKSIKTLGLVWKKVEGLQLPLEAREGCTFTRVGKEGWIFGGINEEIICRVARFNFVTMSIQYENLPSELNMPRFNHSAHIFRNKIIFFGGEIFDEKGFSNKHSLNDLKIFNPKIVEFEDVQPAGDFIAGRHNHASTEFGKNLFVQGGIGDNKAIIEDTWIYNYCKFFSL